MAVSIVTDNQRGVWLTRDTATERPSDPIGGDIYIINDEIHVYTMGKWWILSTDGTVPTDKLVFATQEKISDGVNTQFDLVDKIAGIVYVRIDSDTTVKYLKANEFSFDGSIVHINTPEPSGYIFEFGYLTGESEVIVGLRGPKGDTGATGPKGDTGAAGPEGPMGPKGDATVSNINYRGEWESGMICQPNDVVVSTNPDDKNSYVAVNETMVEPSETSSDWKIFAVRGAPGPAGADGPPGPKGDKGDDGDNGVAGINGTDGKDGDTPYIAASGNWFIGDVDTGISAKGIKGDTGSNGVTPNIDATTGNWFIGINNTGIKAQGPKGDKGDTGAVGPPSELDFSPGTWNSTIVYVKNQVISYQNSIDDKINSYVALGDVPVNTPPSNIYGADSYWALYVSQGPQGDKGEDGSDGTNAISPTLSDNKTWVVEGVDTDIAATTVYKKLFLDASSGVDGAQTTFPIDFPVIEVLTAYKRLFIDDIANSWTRVSTYEFRIEDGNIIFNEPLSIGTEFDMMCLSKSAGSTGDYATTYQLQNTQTNLNTRITEVDNKFNTVQKFYEGTNPVEVSGEDFPQWLADNLNGRKIPNEMMLKVIVTSPVTEYAYVHGVEGEGTSHITFQSAFTFDRVWVRDCSTYGIGFEYTGTPDVDPENPEGFLVPEFTGAMMIVNSTTFAVISAEYPIYVPSINSYMSNTTVGNNVTIGIMNMGSIDNGKSTYDAKIYLIGNGSVEGEITNRGEVILDNDWTGTVGEIKGNGIVLDYRDHKLLDSHKRNHHFSTTEIATGDYWIDGRPIYRRTVQGITIEASDAGKISESLLTGSGIVLVGYGGPGVQGNNSNWHPVGYSDTTVDNAVGVNVAIYSASDKIQLITLAQNPKTFFDGKPFIIWVDYVRD